MTIQTKHNLGEPPKQQDDFAEIREQLSKLPIRRMMRYVDLLPCLHPDTVEEIVQLLQAHMETLLQREVDLTIFNLIERGLFTAEQLDASEKKK
jgi:hypothetical protein